MDISGTQGCSGTPQLLPNRKPSCDQWCGYTRYASVLLPTLGRITLPLYSRKAGDWTVPSCCCSLTLLAWIPLHPPSEPDRRLENEVFLITPERSIGKSSFIHVSVHCRYYLSCLWFKTFIPDEMMMEFLGIGPSKRIRSLNTAIWRRSVIVSLRSLDTLPICLRVD